MKTEAVKQSETGKINGLGLILYAALLTGVSSAGWDIGKPLLWNQRFCGASLHLLLGASLVIAGMSVLYLLLYGIAAIVLKGRGVRTAAFRYGLGWGIFAFYALVMGFSEVIFRQWLHFQGHPLLFLAVAFIGIGSLILVVIFGLLAARLYGWALSSDFVFDAAHMLHILLPLVLLYCGAVAGSSLYANATRMMFVSLCVFSILFILALGYTLSRLIHKGRAGICMLGIVLSLLLPWLWWAMLETESYTVQEVPATTLSVPGVLLIVVDTLRPDALSCYGSENPTPNIDAIASDGILFTDVASTSPWTLPSVVTIHSGRSTRAHGVTMPGDFFPGEGLGIAELFQQQGYHTGAVGFNPFLNEESGLAPGFDSYRMHPPSIFAAPTLGGSLLKGLMVHGAGQTWNGDMALLTDELLTWLEPHQQEPFFAWFHPYTPHIPYSPPKRFIPDSTNWGDSVSLLDFLAVKQGKKILTETDKKDFRELYDAEVRYTDEQIGRLCNVLKEWGIYDDTLIVFTSDHGEEFWDHDSFEHGHTFYQELLHVPLIIKLPGAAAGTVNTSQVSLEDIVPTLAQLCDLNAPPDAFTGRALVDAQGMPQDEAAPRVRYATGTLYEEPGEALLWENYKYIHRFESDTHRLFDLQSDPDELHSLVETQPELKSRALELLEEYKKTGEVNGLGHETDTEGAPVIDKGSRELMQSLGYL